MAKLSPQEQAQKWAERTSAASGAYQAGIERVQQSPGAAAAAKADKWSSAVQESRQKWAARTGAVSLDQWKRDTVAKGAPRFGQGVQQAQGKMGDFVAEFQPFQDRITDEVRRMPDTTQEQRIQRMVTQVRRTAEFRRGRSGMGGAV